MKPKNKTTVYVVVRDLWTGDDTLIRETTILDTCRTSERAEELAGIYRQNFEDYFPKESWKAEFTYYASTYYDE